MEYTYKTKGGVCSRQILFDVEDEIVKSVKFEGGCHGNSQAIEALVVGLSVDEVITKLKGIQCGYKDSSCPDQLANALLELENK
jgi:uncharacterized protein (TIGR03905 family)